MEQKIEIKKPLSPRTLSFIKYVLTLSYVLFYTMPALGFINSLEPDKIATGILTKIQIILAVAAVFAMGLYFVLRINLHKKTTYKYSKKEFMELIIFSVLSVLILILSIVYSFVELQLGELTSQIMFYIFEPIIIALGIVASMLEQHARINEQIAIYNIWYENLDEQEKDKEQEIKNKKSKSNIEIISDEKIIEKEIKNKSNPFMDDESGESND